MFTKKLIAGSVGLALALPVALPAAADTILFDYDGNGTFTQVDAIDWAPGNALAVDSVPLVLGSTFTTYFQAEARAVTGPGGVNTALPTGANGPYEVTFSISLNEQVRVATDVDGDGIADQVTFTHTGGTINVYWDDFTNNTTNADGLTGNSGVGYDDGTLILSATIIPRLLGATFSLTDGTIAELAKLANGTLADLDSYDTDDLGVPTVTGSGNATIQGTNLWYDTNFFDGIGAETIIEFLLNLTLETPFDANNPELLVAGFAPDYGLDGVNGITLSGVTEDFHFEQDGNTSFQTEAVPAPGGLALMGLGLTLLAGFRRRFGMAA